MQVKVFEHEKMEKHPLYVKFVRVFTVPLLNLIPASFLQKLIRRTSPYGSKVIEKPGTTHSLETMYTKDRKAKSSERRADNFWHNFVSQPKAVRNRLKIVGMVLDEELTKRAESKEPVHIYNIGGGSSRAIIQAVSRFLNDHNLEVHVTTLDRDAKALELGRQIAQEHGVDYLFNWIEGDARKLDEYLKPESADIVEMVGLLDYFNYENSIKLITQIYNLLKPGGLFIVANVHPNRESKFVTNVGWPKMHYKTAEEMSGILNASGFGEEEINMYFEPLRVHLVGLARK